MRSAITSPPVTEPTTSLHSRSPRYTGSCLCGAVRYVLTSEPGPIEVCYCSMCRKASGGPLATNADVAACAFHIVAGEALLTPYESSPGEKRYFCSRCGSPIYSERVERAGIVRIRMGAINEPLSVRPVASYYVASRCNWWDIHDTRPRFEKD